MQNTPIQTFIQKFRIQQVKSQLIRGLCQLAIGGILSLLILSILELSQQQLEVSLIQQPIGSFFIQICLLFAQLNLPRAFNHENRGEDDIIPFEKGSILVSLWDNLLLHPLYEDELALNGRKGRVHLSRRSTSTQNAHSIGFSPLSKN